MKSAKLQKLIAALDAAAAENGFELVDVELGSAGRARVLRVFLDRENGLGVGIDELAGANCWVDAVVEENEPCQGAYTLEVSSPGIDRPLRTLEHFARFEGEDAKLVTEPVDGRANWTGTLAGVDTGDILLAIDGQVHRIPHGNVKRAHLKGRVDFGRKGSSQA